MQIASQNRGVPSPKVGSFPLTVTVTTMGYRSYKNPLTKAPLRTVTGRGNDPTLKRKTARPKIHSHLEPRCTARPEEIASGHLAFLAQGLYEVSGIRGARSLDHQKPVKIFRYPEATSLWGCNEFRMPAEFPLQNRIGATNPNADTCHVHATIITPHERNHLGDIGPGSSFSHLPPPLSFLLSLSLPLCFLLSLLSPLLSPLSCLLSSHLSSLLSPLFSLLSLLSSLLSSLFSPLSPNLSLLSSLSSLFSPLSPLSPLLYPLSSLLSPSSYLLSPLLSSLLSPLSPLSSLLSPLSSLLSPLSSLLSPISSLLSSLLSLLSSIS